MKKKLTLSQRWKAETPKIYKVLGDISVVLVVISTTITVGYESLGSLQESIPTWIPPIIAVLSLISKALCKLQTVKELVDNSKILTNE